MVARRRFQVDKPQRPVPLLERAEALVGERVRICRCDGCGALFFALRRAARWCSESCRPPRPREKHQPNAEVP